MAPKDTESVEKAVTVLKGEVFSAISDFKSSNKKAHCYAQPEPIIVRLNQGHKTAFVDKSPFSLVSG